jgi:hypothetical protein
MQGQSSGAHMWNSWSSFCDGTMASWPWRMMITTQYCHIRLREGHSSLWCPECLWEFDHIMPMWLTFSLYLLPKVSTDTQSPHHKSHVRLSNGQSPSANKNTSIDWTGHLGAQRSPLPSQGQRPGTVCAVLILRYTTTLFLWYPSDFSAWLHSWC